MSKSFLKTTAVVGCLALALSLIPLMAGTASAATWTKNPAPPGLVNPNNTFTSPGARLGGELAVGVRQVGAGPDGAAMSMYDPGTSAFTQVGAPGFGNNNNVVMHPDAVYGGELYTGTKNFATGGELYTWSGTGTPVVVPQSVTPTPGWGEGNNSPGALPVAVFNDRLIVCATDASFPALLGFRLMSFDGTTWTELTAPPIATRGLGNTNNMWVLGSESMIFNDQLILPATNWTNGLHVYSFDGSAFNTIGVPGPGAWGANNAQGRIAVSPIDGVAYMGTEDAGAPAGAELWSWDGTTWTEIVGPSPGTPAPGFGDVNNYKFLPLVRGEDLYIAVSNWTNGCSVYQRDNATGNFNIISDMGFDGAVPSNNNETDITSSNGQLMGFTWNPAGSEVWTTPTGPTIDRVVPNSGPYGATVIIEGHDFLNDQGTGAVTFNGAEVRDYLSWSDTSIEALLPSAATTGPVRVSQSNGDSNEVNFTVTLSDTYYFAEGSTRNNPIDGSYEEWISLQNPNAAAANVNLTYMLGDGSTQVQTVTVDPESRFTVDVNGFLGPDVDVSTLVQANQLILAERPMYFSTREGWSGGHDVLGLPAPREIFYFAEGTTRNNIDDGSYQEWLCIQNPGPTPATVNITYMLEDGTTPTETRTIAPTTRDTVDVNLAVGPNHDVSMVVNSDVPIVAERPLYFNYRNKWSGGHDVVGAPGPDTMFNFAEGTTRRNPTDGDFDTWITIQNPQNTAADVTITYYTTTAGVQTQNVTVGPTSRETVDVWLALGSDVDTSFTVESTNNVPILVERPMYFNYHSIWPGGHDVMGCAAPKASWFFAEGATYTGQFDTYVAVMNPSASAATVQITYMIQGGANQTETVTVDPNTRYTTNIAAVAGADKNVSIEIQSDQPIVAERPMYFGYHGIWAGGHDTVGYGI